MSLLEEFRNENQKGDVMTEAEIGVAHLRWKRGPQMQEYIQSLNIKKGKDTDSPHGMSRSNLLH
jgi:hypothetical protein